MKRRSATKKMEKKKSGGKHLLSRERTAGKISKAIKSQTCKGEEENDRTIKRDGDQHRGLEAIKRDG